MKTEVPFFIISAHNNDAALLEGPEYHDYYHDSLKDDLALLSHPHIPVEGKYDGVTEKSFLVFCPKGTADECWQQIRTLGAIYGQQSILFVDANRQAALIYLTERGYVLRTEEIGKWQPVPAGTDLRSLQAYSIIHGRAFYVQPIPDPRTKHYVDYPAWEVAA